jgi:hypothetical protein
VRLRRRTAGVFSANLLAAAEKSHFRRGAERQRIACRGPVYVALAARVPLLRGCKAPAIVGVIFLDAMTPVTRRVRGQWVSKRAFCSAPAVLWGRTDEGAWTPLPPHPARSGQARHGQVPPRDAHQRGDRYHRKPTMTTIHPNGGQVACNH